MTNNPGDENLINLSADVDPSAFEVFRVQLNGIRAETESLTASVNGNNREWEAFRAQLDIAISDAMQKFGQLSSTFGAGADASYEYINALNKIKDASFESGASVSALTSQIKELSNAYQDLPENGWQGYLGPEKAESGYAEYSKGYGVSGGMVGPPTPEEAGPASGGSMFGIAHAMSVGGFTLNAPALREAGAFLYMEQGLQRAIPYLEKFNEQIESQPGVLTPLIGGFEALGLPMAGLIGVLVPMAVTVGGLAFAIGAFNKIIQDSIDLLNKAETQHQGYLDIVTTGTTESVQEGLAKAKDKFAPLNQAFLDNLDNLKRQINEEVNKGVISPETASKILGAYTDYLTGKRTDKPGLTEIWELPAAKVAAISQFIDSIKKQADETAAAKVEVDNYTQALNDGSVAANDLVAQQRNGIEADTKRAELTQADSQLTLEASLSKKEALEADIPVQMKAIADLNTHRNSLEKNSSAWLEDTKLIEDHKQKINDDNDEIKILTDGIQKLTVARSEEREDINRTQEAVEEFNDATDAAHQAQEVYNQQLEVFRQLQEADAAAKIKEQQDIDKENARAADERPRLLAEQADKLADMDAKEADREASMREDAAEKLAAISAKRNEEHLQDAQELGQKIEQAQADHDAKLLDLQAEYQDEDAKALKDHKTRLAEAAERLDAQAIYDEMVAWNNRESDTTAKRQKEETDLQDALDAQIAKERRALDDKYALEAAADKRQYDADSAKYAEQLADQQAQYATQRARQLANDQADLAEFDREHAAKLNEIRNQAQMDYNQRQLDAYREIQQIADTNARKLGIQVAGDAQIEAEFDSWMHRMANKVSAANVQSTYGSTANMIASWGSQEEYHETVGQALSAAPTWQTFAGSGGVVHSNFAEGTPNLGPYIRSVTTHPNESINNEDTSNLIRSRLGGSYSQGDLQALIKGKGGVTIHGGVHPTIQIGDAGQRSDAEIEVIVMRGMTKAFEEIGAGA